jgi:hypothetical protein
VNSRRFSISHQHTAEHLLLQQLMSEDEERSSESRSEESDEVGGELESVGDSEWQVLQDKNKKSEFSMENVA